MHHYLIAEIARLKQTVAELADKNGRDIRITGSGEAQLSSDPVKKRRSALLDAYLKYKIAEFLQPHPGYACDDGFQPLRLIGCAIDSDRKARKLIAKAEGDPLISVLVELVRKGDVIQTPFEPANGDYMLGLPENLGKREAAYEERRSLIIEGAGRRGLHVKWNEDGTGWLELPSGRIARPAGPVWDLLSYLNTSAVEALQRPRLVN